MKENEINTIITGAYRCFILAILVILASISFVQAQKPDRSGCPKTQNKKSLKLYEEAASLYKAKKDFDEARSLVERSIDEDPEFADAYLLQGYLAIRKKEKDYTTMEQSFLKVIELCPDLDPAVYYQLGWLYFDMKKYPQAEKNLKLFLESDRIDTNLADRAELMLARSKLLAHPVPFEPKPVPGITTPDPEYLPYISPDNEMAFFTRRYEMKDKNMLVPTNVEKFIYAERQNGGFD